MPESLFNKVAGIRPTTLLKKRLWHRCFLVNFTKLLRTPFFIEHLWWLLLKTTIKERFHWSSVVSPTSASDFLTNFKYRSSPPEVFCKKCVLKYFTKLTGKHLRQSLFIKKETLAQVFYCEVCKIFKNTYFYRTPLVAAFENRWVKWATKEIWQN